jgi:hypothetical protein
VIAVNEGWRSERPLTPEAVRDGFDVIMADGPLAPLPAGSGDLPKMLEGFTP